MPLSDLQKASVAGGVTQAGSSILGGIFGMIGQRKQRKYEREMYERQLAENRKNWELENLYNSPVQQMQRLKEAGLNPNLVYGNGATAMGGNISSAEPKVSDQSDKLMPFAGIAASPMSAINTLYDLRLKDAQANLLTQKSSTEQTVQELNSVRSGLTAILQQSEQLKLALGQRTFNELVRQSTITTQKLQADLLNTKQDTELKKISTNLGGKRAEGQGLSNELQQLELDLYKGKLGVPGSAIDKAIKALQPLLLLLKSFSK